ncbi:Protein O-linked-mannose beta-1,2-N-acetylglucosaminyltransferase 1, partial [Stegodyphus mimosarum]
MMVQNLSDLFGYIAEELSPNSYCERVAEAFEITNLLFPEASEVIFIGENAVLAPDFLFYMGQLLSILHMDQTILSVSALNENGFKSMSGDPSLSYRAETFSSLAVLVRKNFFQRSWCKKQYLIDPLYISSKIVGDSLIPDVSRVALAAPMESKHSNQDASHVFMSYDRTIT